MLPEAAKNFAEQFNKHYPPGTAVLLIKDLGEVVQDITKSPAIYSEINEAPVIWLNNQRGFWLLDRVIPLPANRPEKTAVSPEPCYFLIVTYDQDIGPIGGIESHEGLPIDEMVYAETQDPGVYFTLFLREALPIRQ